MDWERKAKSWEAYFPNCPALLGGDLLQISELDLFLVFPRLGQNNAVSLQTVCAAKELVLQLGKEKRVCEYLASIIIDGIK